MYIYICVSRYTYTYICIYSVSIHIHIHVYIHIHTYVCIYMYTHIYVSSTNLIVPYELSVSSRGLLFNRLKFTLTEAFVQYMYIFTYMHTCQCFNLCVMYVYMYINVHT